MKKIFTLLLVSISVALSVSAQETKLKEVPVYGSKLSNIGKAVSLIDTNKITFLSQETPNLLSQSVPSVFYQSDNGTPFGYSYFFLRGMSQNRLNYTLNGIPLNDGEDMSVYTTNYSNLFQNLSSIEVQRGAGINITGNAAFAGSLNFQTVDLNDPEYSKIDLMFGSYNSGKVSASYNSGRRNDGFGLYINQSVTHSDGFRDNSSGTSYTNFISTDLVKSKFSLKFNNLFSQTENQMAWLPTPEGLPVRTNILTPEEKDKFTANISQLQFSYKLSDSLTLNSSAYFNYLQGGYNYLLQPGEYGQLLLEAKNVGGYANLSYITSKNKLAGGVSYNRYDREHKGFIQPLVTPIYKNNGVKNEISSFISYTRFFKKSNLNVGVQYRNVGLAYNSPSLTTKLFQYGFVNGNIAYTHKLNKNIDIYGSQSLAHREPTRTDLLGVNDDISDINSLNDVKPERVLDSELGIKIHTSKLTGSINAFYLNFDNEIISTNQLNYLSILLRKNVKESNRYGIETDLTYTINERFQLFNVSAYNKSNIVLNGDNKVPVLTPEFIVNQTVRYNVKNGGVGLSYSYMSPSYLENTNVKAYQLPESHVLSLTSDYRLNKTIKLTLLLDNLTDVNYRQSGSANYNENGELSGRSFFYSAGFSVYGGISFTLR